MHFHFVFQLGGVVSSYNCIYLFFLYEVQITTLFGQHYSSS